MFTYTTIVYTRCLHIPLLCIPGVYICHYCVYQVFTYTIDTPHLPFAISDKRLVSTQPLDYETQSEWTVSCSVDGVDTLGVRVQLQADAKVRAVQEFNTREVGRQGKFYFHFLGVDDIM